MVNNSELWSSATRLSTFLNQIKFGTSGIRMHDLSIVGERAANFAILTRYLSLAYVLLLQFTKIGPTKWNALNYYSRLW